MNTSGTNPLSENGRRIVITGANDGQTHGFETGMGAEVWSFIPPNLLPKMEDWVHTSHPTTKRHEYFVDGPFSVADVWLGTGDGTGKLATDWRTLAVIGLGRGVRGPGDQPDYLWSASPHCDGQFKDKYNPPHRYYCGYYGLDVTNTTYFPEFRWVLGTNDSESPYLGEPWSKMVMGRVMIAGEERWVGFIGGGYTMGPNIDSRKNAGKGFFVVDLRTGNVLWSHTKRDNDAMGFIPGTPAIVDRDNDGFIDTAYVGDLSGNLWKFTFCPFDPTGGECGPSNWGAMILYNPGGDKLPTFNTPAVAKDRNYYWIFWGTGDRANPNNESPQNKFLAIRDQSPTSAYTLSNLQNITNTPIFTETARNGWYINFSGQERVLSDATGFGGIVFFTSYSPSTENLCGTAGSAALYGIAMMTISIGGETYDPGKGIFQSGENFGRKSPSLGTGIPSAPVISLKPLEVEGGVPDVYVTVSGGSGRPAETKSSSGISEDISRSLAGFGPTTSIIHWRDLRVQP